MEWAVCAASSDSEDATTQEINDEEEAPCNGDQRDSLYGSGEQSITKDAHGSVEVTSVKEAASSRNGQDSLDPVKAEAGKKLSDKGSRDLNHFDKKQGIKRSAPDSVGSTCTVNVSEGDGIPDRDPENIAMQRRSEEEDEKQAMVPQEDLGESAEELEFDSSTSTNGVSQKLNPGRSETQRKKRNLTEDGPGQASKLVKRFENPPKNQLTCASTECGESASDSSCSQWNESFQSKHLEENWAAEESVTCTESKEMRSPSSESVEHQEVHTWEGKDHCAECNITCRNAELLNRHLLMEQRKPYKCLDCNKRFATEDGMGNHRRAAHNVEKPFQCTQCNFTFKTLLLQNRHHLTAHGTKGSFKCPECSKYFSTVDGMSEHRLWSHNVEKPFQCTECNLTFSRVLLRNEHSLTAHQSFTCPECMKCFITADGMSEHRCTSHNVENPFQCTKCNLTFNSLLLRNGHCHTDHGTEEGFKCSECKEHFPTLRRLRKHGRLTHFRCTECKFKFDSELQLCMHNYKFHGTEETFKCPDCNTQFFNAEIMKEHRLIIHNVKECFSCPDCTKEFISLGTLLAHHVACTGGLPVQCAECNIILTNESQLRHHQFKVHKIKIQFGCSDYTEAFSVDETFDWQ